MGKYRIYREYIGMIDSVETIYSPDYTDCIEHYVQVPAVIKEEKTEMSFNNEEEAIEFCNKENGKNFDVRYVYDFELVHKKHHLFKDATFTTLRHTFAARCVEINVDLKSLSNILGHENINTNAKLYSQFYNKSKENIKKINALMQKFN